METGQTDYSRKWYVMSAVATGVFLSTIDGSIVNIALPTLVRNFDSQFNIVQWVVLAYLLTVTTLMLSMGRLGDMVGKKPIYMTGFVVFIIGSLLCGTAINIFWLIAFRVLQAIGASMMMALGTAIVTEAFPSEERGKALGVIGSMVSIGIVIGPVLGGLLIDLLSWRWIFYVNLPIGVLGVFMVLRYVPPIRAIGKQSFDLLGALTLFISLIGLLIGLTLGQTSGFYQFEIYVLGMIFIIFLIGFLIVEWNHPQPMVDLRLFRNRLFSGNLVMGLITFVSIAGTIIIMPFYLEDVLGFSPSSVGMLMSIVPVSMGIIAPIAGSLSDKYGSRLISAIGLFILVIGYIAVSTLSADTSIGGYLLRFIPIGLGMGTFQSPNNSAIMGAAPRERLGIVSGLLAITRTLGQTIGIAILGSVWASRIVMRMGEGDIGNTELAPIAVRIAGLKDTFLVVVVLIGVAFVISLWAFRRGQFERKITVVEK